MRGWTLSEEDRERRWIIQRLLCLGELRAEQYAEEFGRDFVGRYASELARLAPMERDGLVVRAPDGSLELSTAGRLLVRNVAAVFDAYLPKQQEQSKPLFSQTV